MMKAIQAHIATYQESLLIHSLLKKVALLVNFFGTIYSAYL